jgi:hypothetical protein
MSATTLFNAVSLPMVSSVASRSLMSRAGR